MALGECEQDALTEIFNIGVGLAADALHQLTGQHVPLSVPVVALGTQDIAWQPLLHREQPWYAIRQTWQGVVTTEAVLVLPQQSSLTLARLMVGPELAADQLDGVALDALTELGNILLSAVMSELAGALGLPLEGSLPSVSAVQSSRGLANACGGTVGLPNTTGVLALTVDFQFSEPQVPGFMVFLLDAASSQELMARLRRYVAGPAA